MSTPASTGCFLNPPHESLFEFTGLLYRSWAQYSTTDGTTPKTSAIAAACSIARWDLCSFPILRVSFRKFGPACLICCLGIGGSGRTLYEVPFRDVQYSKGFKFRAPNLFPGSLRVCSWAAISAGDTRCATFDSLLTQTSRSLFNLSFVLIARDPNQHIIPHWRSSHSSIIGHTASF